MINFEYPNNLDVSTKFQFNPKHNTLEEISFEEFQDGHHCSHLVYLNETVTMVFKS